MFTHLPSYPSRQFFYKIMLKSRFESKTFNMISTFIYTRPTFIICSSYEELLSIILHTRRVRPLPTNT